LRDYLGEERTSLAMPIYLTVWRATGLNAAYRVAFEFWLEIFGLAFGLSVVDLRKMVGHGVGGG
jgi:hypothetical protein